MNFPDTSTMRDPAGIGQLARVPAQTIRPSLATTDPFGIDGPRGRMRVPPTSAITEAWAEAVVAQTSNKSRTFNYSSSLRCHRRQFFNRVHVAGSALSRCGYLQFRATHARAVAHIYLPPSETDFLVYSSRYAIESIKGRRCIQKDCHSAIRGRIRKRVSRQHFCHLFCSAYHNPHRFAGEGEESTLERLAHGGLRKCGVEHHVPARDVRSNVAEPGGFAHRFEIRHRQLTGSSNIYGSKECDEGCHSTPIYRSAGGET